MSIKDPDQDIEHGLLKILDWAAIHPKWLADSFSLLKWIFSSSKIPIVDIQILILVSIQHVLVLV